MNNNVVMNQIAERLKKVHHKIAILSGKGGVGKSTVAANLALAFSKKYPDRVGIIDIDITGPNIPLILGLEGKKIMSASEKSALPVTGPLGLKVVSMAFLLETKDSPVIWRGPMKTRAIQQFISDFEWGELDYLVFDMPPGTGDETITLLQTIPDMDGVVLVTTPQELSTLDTAKSLQMVRKMNLPVLGVIENMSGFICPNCNTKHYLFGQGGGKSLAERMNVPLLGEIPIRMEIREKEDQGIQEPFVEFLEIASKIEKLITTE